MSIENDQPAMTRPMSDALMDALQRLTRITYDDQEAAQ
jgi:hypothetical protein